MAYETIKQHKTINAGADLRTKQFTFVKIDTTGRLVSSTNGGDSIGVLQDKPNTGDPGMVAQTGDITKMVCGGAVPAGAAVASDGNGKAIAAVTGAFVLGVNLGIVGATDTVVSILFEPRGSKL